MAIARTKLACAGELCEIRVGTQIRIYPTGRNPVDWVREPIRLTVEAIWSESADVNTIGGPYSGKVIIEGLDREDVHWEFSLPFTYHVISDLELFAEELDIAASLDETLLNEHVTILRHIASLARIAARKAHPR